MFRLISWNLRNAADTERIAGIAKGTAQRAPTRPIPLSLERIDRALNGGAS